jgi:hypothetical protein
MALLTQPLFNTKENYHVYWTAKLKLLFDTVSEDAGGLHRVSNSGR